MGKKKRKKERKIQFSHYAKRHIVLDPDHRITKLLIQYYHELVHHLHQDKQSSNAILDAENQKSSTKYLEQQLALQKPVLWFDLIE